VTRAASWPRARTSIFITNACLCYPLVDGYTDRVPTAREIINCQYWLRQQIQAVNPKLIVTCGASALAAVKRYFPESRALQGFHLRHHIGTVVKDTCPWVYPVYHTFLRARNRWRTANQQRGDWVQIRKVLLELDVQVALPGG